MECPVVIRVVRATKYIYGGRGVDVIAAINIPPLWLLKNFSLLINEV